MQPGTNNGDKGERDTDHKDDDDKVELVSSDGTVFTLDRKYARLSQVVCEHDAKRSSKHSQSSRLRLETGILAVVLTPLVDYLRQHKGVPGPALPTPLPCNDMKVVCKEFPWDAEFVDSLWERDNVTFYDLMHVAADSKTHKAAGNTNGDSRVTFLDVHCLLHLLAAKAASRIKGLPYESFKERFKLHGPRAEERLAELRGRTKVEEQQQQRSSPLK